MNNPNLITVKPETPADCYRRMADGMDGQWSAAFSSHREALDFVRLAGGTNIVRVGKSWNWTMPDGATARIDDDIDDNHIDFTPAVRPA
jgi:hypothetical protein